MMRRYIIGITGATGSIYGYKLAEALLMSHFEVHVIITKTGQKVMEYELENTLDRLMNQLSRLSGILHVENINDYFASIASGSYKTDGMMIAPCSMGTLGKISAGTADNLLIRATDVCLKEKRKLILLTRETPLNTIHLENMLRISNAGGIIMPPVPSFYTKPQTIDNIVTETVGRALNLLGVENDLHSTWQSQGFNI